MYAHINTHLLPRPKLQPNCIVSSALDICVLSFCRRRRNLAVLLKSPEFVCTADFAGNTSARVAKELSGYLVTHLMPAWEDEKLHLPVLKDGYELRKQILGQLLTFKENECENNMPAGILEFISCIREIQNKAGMPNDSNI